MTASGIVLYHAPNTRSTAVRVLLEELGIPSALRVLNMTKGEQREPAYMAVNPMGKVPAIVHNGVLVTEQVAIFIYLSDLAAKADLSPGLNDALRGAWLRWLVYYAASFEPAVVDKALQRVPGRQSMMPYGDYEITIDILEGQLGRGPYILGERFTTADILWGSALAWTTAFKLVPERPVIMDYIQRITRRPAFAKIQTDDAALAAGQAA